MLPLKSKTVEIEGVGTVEFREPLYDLVEPMLIEGNQNLGRDILKLCAYQDGERMFDKPVGITTFMALLAKVDVCMEVCGMGEAKKD